MRRKQESEADEIGVMLAARACFEPRAAAIVFTKLGEKEKQMAQVPQWLLTHPLSKVRPVCKGIVIFDRAPGEVVGVGFSMHLFQTRCWTDEAPADVHARRMITPLHGSVRNAGCIDTLLLLLAAAVLPAHL